MTGSALAKGQANDWLGRAVSCRGDFFLSPWARSSSSWSLSSSPTPFLDTPTWLLPVERRRGSDAVDLGARDAELEAELDPCPELGLLLDSPKVFLLSVRLV